MNNYACSYTKAVSVWINEPLETLGVFKSKIQCGCEEIEAEFIVIAGKGRTLLGREAAVQLGVLSLGPQGNAVELSMTDRYPECFQAWENLRIIKQRFILTSRSDQ